MDPRSARTVYKTLVETKIVMRMQIISLKIAENYVSSRVTF